VIPSTSFSVANVESTGVAITAPQAAGVTFAISSMTVENLGTTPEVAEVFVQQQCNGLPTGDAQGPQIMVPSNDTISVTFPQPFTIRNPAPGDCLAFAPAPGTLMRGSFVGYTF
jgi:hypothetical protein